MNKFIIYMLLIASSTSLALAQTTNLEKDIKLKHSKAWEFGLGGSVFQFSRTSFTNFTQLKDSYQFDLKLKQALFGGNLYVARELNNHFYLDIQGTIGATKGTLNRHDKTQWLYMVGPGLQWRLGEYFDSKYIDPYFRVGGNYMYKQFDIQYTGTEGLTPDQMTWIQNNLNNKDGRDRKHMIVASLGFGLNMWLNDKWGIGLQGDYLLMPYKNVANSLQGTARVIMRIGGDSKKGQPIERYIEVEKIVEKVIQVPTNNLAATTLTSSDRTTRLIDFINIPFEFDKAIIKPESVPILDQLASDLKSGDQSKRYLITGYTDSLGSAKYNEKLSRERANAVVAELVQRGVDPLILKSRGVGSKIAYANPNTDNETREGDRKVTIELITNSKYWDYLP